METSMWLAQLFGITYLAVGLGMLLSGDYYQKMMAEMMDSKPVMYVMSIIALIVGLLIVTHHNTWGQDWTMLVTLIGWIALLKGFFMLAFPKSMKNFKSLTQPQNFKKFAWIPFVLGLIFTYLGFWS